MDITFYLGLIIILVLVIVPFALSWLGQYRTPESMQQSLKDNGLAVLGAFVVIIALDALRYGVSPEKWHWGLLLALLCGATLRLAIDWFMIHRERRREFM